MTVNWGHKLILVFMVFGGLMSFMVYKSVKTNYDLVSTEYYKDELTYQKIIDGTNKANLLKEKISVMQSGNTITIKVPVDGKDEIIAGESWFYCATDARKDRKIKMQINAEGEQVINIRSFAPGNYIVKMNWNNGGQHYYAEQNLNIH